MTVSKLQFVVIVLVPFILIQNSIAQNFLDHSTGNLTVSVMDDGAFGINDSTSERPGHVGNGVVFMGNVNASYTGGLIMGNSSTKCSGHLGSFSIIFEMLTSTPFSGFTSNSNFNQIATCTFSDSAAPTVNQLGLSVQQTSYSNTGDNFVILDFTITNNTASPVNGAYVGQFQDWDIGVTQYFNNNGGYDQSRNLAYQYLNGGNPDPSYYGIVALSGWSGARVTTLWNPTTVRDSAYAWMSTFLNESITTNGDYRTFIGSGPYNLDVGTSVRVGFAYCAGVDLVGLQDAATEAQFKWDNYVVPVELSSFTANIINGNVILNWVTATEINNQGFEVQRSSSNSEFTTIGFVIGKGTTTERQEYSYVDRNVTTGKYFYRLKQIDFDGTFEYLPTGQAGSIEIEVDAAPVSFSLEQNYPNPFNPSTTIRFGLPEKEFVSLKIYDVMGNEVAILMNEEKPAGSHSVEFDASGLASGTYFYKLQAGSNITTRKMILLK